MSPTSTFRRPRCCRTNHDEWSALWWLCRHHLSASSRWRTHTAHRQAGRRQPQNLRDVDLLPPSHPRQLVASTSRRRRTVVNPVVVNAAYFYRQTTAATNADVTILVQPQIRWRQLRTISATLYTEPVRPPVTSSSPCRENHITT